MTTAKRAAKCVTHHKACDCREHWISEFIQQAKGTVVEDCLKCKCFYGFNPRELCKSCHTARLKEMIKEYDAR